MRNVLSADLYRLSRQKSTWLLPVFTLLAVFLLSCLNGFLFGNAPWVKEIHEAIASGAAQVDDQAGLNGSLSSVSMLFGGTFKSTADYITTTFQRDTMIVLVLFVSFYAASVRRNGFCKNIGKIYNSAVYNISQALVILAYSLVIIFVNLGASLLASTIFFTGMEFGNAGSLLLYFLITGVLHWAEALMVVLMCDFFKNPSTGVIIGCLYNGLIVSLACSLLNSLFAMVLKTDFKLNHIMPYGFSMIMKYDDTKSYLYGVALAAIYVVIFFIGKALVRKKDVA